MLAADKDRLVAGLKQNALVLRQKELEYYVERYSNITTQASILAGFAFDSLVELEIPEPMFTKRAAFCTIYYISASCTMAFALYTVVVSSFATVYGHRLALQGPTGSVDRAVAVMMKQRFAIFFTFGVAMASLVVAAVSMAWLKMDFAHCDEEVVKEDCNGTFAELAEWTNDKCCHTGTGVTPAIITGIFVLFFATLVWKHQDMKGLFNIPQERIVQGDVRLVASTHALDCAQLEAGFGPHDDPPMSVSDADVAALQAARASSNGNGKGPMYQPTLSRCSEGTALYGSEVSNQPLLLQSEAGAGGR